MNRATSHSWQTIQEDIKTRIAKREWAPGELIPNEVDLAEAFGCARVTVNRAMQELANTGLVERRRKAGTRVALNPVRHATLKIPLIREEVERRGAVWHHSVLKQEMKKASADFARRHCLKIGSSVIFIQSLHFADQKPYLFEDRWISTDAVPRVKQVDFETISANEWLVQNAPFTRGDISFAACGASGGEAKYLDVEVGTAIFIVERMTWAGDKPVTSVRLSYAPGYKMQTTI